MCLAIPMKIKILRGSWAQVEAQGLLQEVNIQLVPQADIGDYVLVHAGFAIQRIDRELAGESLELWEQIKQ